MMDVGARIKAIRTQRGWSIRDLAKRINGDVGNLSRLERGQQGYTDTLLRKIAHAFAISVSELFLEEESITPTLSLDAKHVPLIDFSQVIQWSNRTESKENVSRNMSWIYTNIETSVDTFALQINDESMLPEFKEKDIIIVDPSIKPTPGDFVVVNYQESKNQAILYKTIFRRYKPRLSGTGELVFDLIALNDNYLSLFSDINQIQIVGKVVEHRRFFSNYQ